MPCALLAIPGSCYELSNCHTTLQRADNADKRAIARSREQHSSFAGSSHKSTTKYLS